MANRRRDVEKEQYWRLVLDEFTASGLSGREFCRREKLSESSFYSWRRELRKRDSTHRARPRKQAAPTLIEVVTRSTSVSTPIEIETPTGFTIRLDAQMNRETLASVLGMLPLEKGPC